MQRAIITGVLMIGLFFVATSKAQTPQFSDYPAKIEQGTAEKIEARSLSNGIQYSTAELEQALRGGVNFAGQYVLESFGCGLQNCNSSVIIHSRTGWGATPEQLLFTEYGGGELDDKPPLEYKADSRLLIINGNIMSDGFGYGIRYFEWIEGGLKLIKFEKKKPTPSNEETTFKAFLQLFQSAVEKKDKQAVAGLTRFPLEMPPENYSDIEKEDDLIAHFDEIFSNKIAKCLAKETVVFSAPKPKYDIRCPSRLFYHFEKTSTGWKFVKFVDGDVF